MSELNAVMTQLQAIHLSAGVMWVIFVSIFVVRAIYRRLKHVAEARSWSALNVEKFFITVLIAMGITAPVVWLFPSGWSAFDAILIILQLGFLDGVGVFFSAVSATKQE